MESLKREVQDLLDVCSDTIKPNMLDAPSVKSELYKEIANFLYFLSASDGSIHEKEKKFLNDLLDKDITMKDMALYITTHSIYSKKFEQTLPSIYTLLLADAKKAQLYISVFEKLGKEFIVIDQKADEKETENLTIYLSLLQNAYKKEHTKQEDLTTLDELLQQLDQLIGLSDVKMNVNSLVHLQDIQLEREKRGLPKVPISNHLVFTGNPGTGKTTVARLLAKIYNKIGVLETGNFVEVDRAGLVAGYVGQTAIKVNEVVDQAKGGILFIDEAYALTSHGDKNDFGYEAIETLLKRMEDERDNLIVIVSGYPDLMEQFIHSNPGLESRFRKKIHFEDYTPEEMVEILMYTARQHKFTIEEKALSYVYELYKESSSHRKDDFANAREVRNLFETAVIKQADRLFGKECISDIDLCTLIEEDFK